MYSLMGASPNRTELSWRFKGGGKVQFGHLQHPDDVFGWQGSELDFCAFDELTHFTEEQFWYLLSRLRSLSGVRPYVRATTNPAPGWVRELLAPWVMKNYAGPGGRAQSGEVRSFVRREGEIVWLVGGEAPRKGEIARTLSFVRSTIYDNSILLDSDPDYLGNLMALPETERRRLLEGDWDVFEGAFLSEWQESFHCVAPPYTPQSRPPSYWRWFGGLDWGYAAPFAFVLCATDEYGNAHVVESIHHKGLTNEAQADKVLAVLSKWGVHPSVCPISFDASMAARKTLNGIQGEADIEAFHRAGLRCAPSDRDRRAGWSVLRRWLHSRTGEGNSEPAFRVWRGYNAALVHMLPMAQFSQTDPEDMDESLSDGQGGHWDVLQALRYAFRLRPRIAQTPPPEQFSLPPQLRTDNGSSQRQYIR
jgi:hypothetical protein